jgi:hypothetical protein
LFQSGEKKTPKAKKHLALTDSLFLGLHHLTFFSPPSLKKKSRDESRGGRERERAQKPRATRNGKFPRAELQRSKSASSKTTTDSKEEKIREEEEEAEEATRPIDDRDDGDGENC